MSESPKKTRPRPRPRPRSVTSSIQVNEPGSSSKSPPILEDETATFFRNRNRKASNWRELNKVIEKREAVRAQTQDLSSSDYDSDSPRTKKARRQPFVPKPKELPAWTKQDGLILVKDSDGEKSSSDGDASGNVEKVINEAASPERITKAKKKRRPSRSSSASSDPEVYIAEQEGRARAREFLGSQTARREKSPTYISDNDEGPDAGVDLPAEFAAIRAEMKRSSTRGASVDDATLTSVDLQIILRPHPENQTGRSHIYFRRLRRNEKFEQLFNEIADEAGIPTERLFVFYNNHRVYPWSTPQTLSIWSEAELIAYEEHVYKYIKAHEKRTSTSADIESAATLEHADYEKDGASPSEPSQDKSDSYKLHVRIGEKTITISVRNTTRCGKIVEKALQKMGRPASVVKKARIVVDGEKLDPGSAIGDAELEDGDLIDIVDA